MADTKITDLAAITGANTAAGDQFVVVDVSDTTMASSGTDKKITKAELLTVFEAAGAAAAAQAASQPLDSDLTAIAALSTTSFGRGLLALADAAALRSTVGSATDTTTGVVELATTLEVTTGTDTVRATTPAGVKAAIDAAVAALIASAPGVLDTLDELAAALGDDPNFAATITTALAGKQPIDSDLTAIASLTTTTYGRAFLTLADQAALMALVPAASDTVQGKVELATTAETTTGTDTARAVTPAGLLNATTASNINARIGVGKAGSLVGTRRRINFIDGSGATVTVVDDAGNEEVDVTIAASGGGGGLGAQPQLALTFGGVAYTSIPGLSLVGPAGNLALSADIAYYTPIVVTGGTLTISAAVLRVTTAAAAGNNARIAIYSADGDWQPGNLVSDLGAVAVDVTGRRALTGLSVDLSTGFYLARLHTQAAVTMETWFWSCPWWTGVPVTQNGNASYGQLSRAYGVAETPGTAYTSIGSHQNYVSGFVTFTW